MKRKYISCVLVITLFMMIIAGCASSNIATTSVSGISVDNEENKTDSGQVDLLVWVGEDDMEMTQRMIDSFCEEYAGQAQFQITISPVAPGEVRGFALQDVLAAADVFAFPDDQFSSFISAGLLEPIADQDKVQADNVSGTVEAATYQDVVYAYPYAADNGYFLYYDKNYLSKEDVQTLDGILRVAQETDKKFVMDLYSGWYLYSFFGNTGLELGINPDGVTNYCTWNSTENPIKGIDVLTAIMDLIDHTSFSPQSDTIFMDGIRDGSTIAGISGTWNAMSVKEVWGDDYGAVKLPTYTVAGKQVQMSSFTGYRMMGVNHYSKHVEWALKLAEWLTNEQNQTIRFEEKNLGPSNKNVAASDEVSRVPAVSAIIEQSQYGSLQRIGGKFWDPCVDFAETLVAGNPNNTPLQTLLDDLVAKITASAAN